jgi:16S rRNA (cytidine1402-2'-O)-methyltransferase
MPAGKIYLIPTPISDANANSVLPEMVLGTIHNLDTFFVEKIRTTRRFLSSMGVKNIQDLHFEVLYKNTAPKFLEHLM